MKVVSTSEDRNESTHQKGKRDQAGRGRIAGVALFTAGTILGMFLIGISVYADFEATLFGTIVPNETIRPIRCPVFISDTETGWVLASIRNKNENPSDIRVNAHISKGHLILMREFDDTILLEPGQSQKFSWEIYPEDAAYGHLILVRVVVMNPRSSITHRGSCGVVVLNLPGQMKGSNLFWLLFVSALIFMISGSALWWNYGRSYTGRRLEATRSILGLGILVLVGLTSAAAGVWELAAGSFYIGVLMIGVIVPHFMITR